jgi:hypothetical protein
MSDTQHIAQAALSQRLRSLLPDEVTQHFVGGTHTRRFADNLLSSLSAEQVRIARSQLDRGAGGELKPTTSGKRRAHAPYSSAALAANAFAGWIGAEDQLQIAGLGGFDETISLEHKLRIAYGGGEANLDCVLMTSGSLVGIESKLTETLAAHDPVEWRSPYLEPKMETLLDGGWQLTFKASVRREWTPRHLGLEQLIKHALALNSHAGERSTHLVYVFWEPANGDEIAEVREHRAEVEQLLNRVADAQPYLHAMTYDQLLSQWANASPEASRQQDHIVHLQARYGDINV